MIRNKNWKHFLTQDKFYQKAKQFNLISRAWFKLNEIQKKFNLIQNYYNILELGSAPGSWTKLIQTIIKKGKIFCCDILPMKKYKNITYINGDICKKKTHQLIIKTTKPYYIHLILSDISPNLTGIKIIDNKNIVKIFNNILFLCKSLLIHNGHLLTKIFINEFYKYFIQHLNKKFKKIYIYKPIATKKSSKELYLIGMYYK